MAGGVNKAWLILRERHPHSSMEVNGRGCEQSMVNTQREASPFVDGSQWQGCEQSMVNTQREGSPFVDGSQWQGCEQSMVNTQREASPLIQYNSFKHR